MAVSMTYQRQSRFIRGWRHAVLLNPNLGRVIEGPVPGRKIAHAYRMRTLPVLG
jgi:hypothetical protein